jgi:Sec-independent protein secretion pathway component TatC
VSRVARAVPHVIGGIWLAVIAFFALSVIVSPADDVLIAVLLGILAQIIFARGINLWIDGNKEALAQKTDGEVD